MAHVVASTPHLDAAALVVSHDEDVLHLRAQAKQGVTAGRQAGPQHGQVRATPETLMAQSQLVLHRRAGNVTWS